MTSVGLVAAAAAVGEPVEGAPAGVGARRPGVEGAGAVRKPVVVPAALVGRGTAVAPERTPALEAVSYRLPVAVVVAASLIVPAAVP
jgi:hypothetical protein